MSEANGASRRSARDRLLEAADRLFYDEGVHQVGIDRVLEESGVAKGSLYYNFSGKDELVRTYLQNRHARWEAKINEYLERASTPRDRVLSVFDALGELFAQPDFRGCAFINAAAEATEGSGEALAAKDFRHWLHGLFRDLVESADVATPNDLAAQLVLLYDGSNISAQMDQNPQAAATARSAASHLMGSAT